MAMKNRFSEEDLAGRDPKAIERQISRRAQIAPMMVNSEPKLRPVPTTTTPIEPAGIEQPLMAPDMRPLMAALAHQQAQPPSMGPMMAAPAVPQQMPGPQPLMPPDAPGIAPIGADDAYMRWLMMNGGYGGMV